MLDINLRHLEVFAAVTEYNSFTKAAESLYLSQSTVSAHIQSLEKALGVTLFQRLARRKIVLTQEGERIYGIVLDILDRCRLLQESLREGRHTPVLTVAASTVPAQYWLPKCLAAFSRENPDCRFLLRRADSLRVHEMLAAGEAELGFVGLRQDTEKFTYRPVFRDELVLITENAPRFRDLDRDWGERLLLRENVVLREESSGTRRFTQEWLQLRGISLQSLHVIAELENPASIRQAVMEGMGVSVISALAVEEDVAAGRLLRFPLGETGLYRQIYLALLNREKHPALLERFLRFLSAREPGAGSAEDSGT